MTSYIITLSTHRRKLISPIQHFFLAARIFFCTLCLFLAPTLNLHATEISLPSFPTQTLTLKNGLKVIVREDRRAKIVTSQLWYRVGASDEPLGSTGISHLLEHAMFLGTKTVESGKFSEIIYQLGGHDNAFTTADFTAYYATVQPDALETVLNFEADRMQHLRVDNAAFLNEKQVVLEERRLRIDNKPISAAYEIFLRNALPVSSYGQPVIGWQQDIENINHEKLMQWYQDWYAPNNATLIIVGDVNAQEIFALVEKIFGHIESRSLPTRAFTPDPTIETKRSLEIRLKAALPAVFLGFNVPSYVNTPDKSTSYALAIIEKLLGNSENSESSKFVSQLVRDKKFVTSIYADYDPWRRGDSLFTVFAIPNQEQGAKNEDIIQAIMQAIEEIKQGKFTDDDLKRVKRQMLAAFIYSQDSVYEQARWLGMLESLSIPWQDGDKAIEELQNISREKIIDTAKKYLRETVMTTGLLIPTP